MLPAAAANPNGNPWKTQQCLHHVRHHLVRLTANLYVHHKFKRVKLEHSLLDGEAPKKKEVYEETSTVLYLKPRAFLVRGNEIQTNA